MQRGGEISARLGDTLWAQRYAQSAEKYRTQAAAVREANGLADAAEGRTPPTPQTYSSYGAYTVTYGPPPDKNET